MPAAQRARKAPPAPPVPDSAPVQFPGTLIPIFQPYRYKVLWGGRGGAKSWSIARALLTLAMYDPLRILCAREVMRTIADSVHRLLTDQIMAVPEFKAWYSVRETSITGVNGAEFLYTGLRSIDADKIKSYEGVDIAWVEEGQVLSQRSLDILIPTIRAPGSEIWISMNPELDTDEVYSRFIASTPPPRSWVQKIGWQENPWFPDVLEEERQTALRRDPVEYEHIWEGRPRSVVAGAIYATEVVKMIEERRVRPVPYDPQLPVHTIWDLGWNDQTTVIFVQRMLSEIRVIDYAEESFMRFDQWAKTLRDKPYIYGSHWLPHDGGNATQAGNGKSAQEMLEPLLRMRPKLIARPATKEVPIRAARMMFPRAYVDETKCQRLLMCLKRFRRAVPETTGEPGSPVHDEYSHGADAWGGLALIVDQISNETDAPIQNIPSYGVLDQAVGF